MDEISIVSNPILSLEMIIIRLIHLKDMPSYENLLNSLDNVPSIKSSDNIIDANKIKNNLNEKGEGNNISKDQIKNTTQTKLELTSPNPKELSQKPKAEKISSFVELIELSSEKRSLSHLNPRFCKYFSTISSAPSSLGVILGHLTSSWVKLIGSKFKLFINHAINH